MLRVLTFSTLYPDSARPAFGLFVERQTLALAARPGARAALPLLRELKFDVIDAEFFWPDGVAAMHLAGALGLPFSVKARGSDIHFWGRRPRAAEQMVEAAGKAG